jgi:hypothetical protein
LEHLFAGTAMQGFLAKILGILFSVPDKAEGELSEIL